MRNTVKPKQQSLNKLNISNIQSLSVSEKHTVSALGVFAIHLPKKTGDKIPFESHKVIT